MTQSSLCIHPGSMLFPMTSMTRILPGPLATIQPYDLKFTVLFLSFAWNMWRKAVVNINCAKAFLSQWNWDIILLLGDKVSAQNGLRPLPLSATFIYFFCNMTILFIHLAVILEPHDTTAKMVKSQWWSCLEFQDTMQIAITLLAPKLKEVNYLRTIIYHNKCIHWK